MRVFFYLDNLIVTARSKSWAIFHTAQLILNLNNLGFAINWEMSVPRTRQEAEYLGIVLNAASLRASWLELRQTTLLQAVHRLQQGKVRSVMQLLGLMAADHQVVLLGLLRQLQRWFTSLHLDLRRHKRWCRAPGGFPSPPALQSPGNTCADKDQQPHNGGLH